MDADNAILKRNLAALPPALSERIRAAAAGPGLPHDRSGQPCLARHRTLIALAWTPPPEALARVSDPAAQVLLFGVGLGEGIAATLALRGEGAAPVHAWEPRAAVLAEALRRHDWSRALASGALRLALGLDLLDIPHAGSIPVLEHPAVVGLEPWARRALLQGFGVPRAVVRAGGLLVRELAERLEDLGYQPWVLDLEGPPPAQVRADLVRLQPALAVSINHMVGLPELCAQLQLPLVEWEIDPSTERLLARRGPVHTTTIATWRRRSLPEWREAGFADVHHLPLSADTSLRRPVSAEELDGHEMDAAVVFVGNSLVESAGPHLRAAQKLVARYLASQGRDPQRAIAIVEALVTQQRRDPARWTLPEQMRVRLPGLDAFLRRSGVAVQPDQLLGEMLGAEWRLNAVATCAPYGAQVWGDRGWQRLGDRGVRWRGPAGARQQLTRIYNGAAINLDVGRIYQRDIVTLRVFDVLACGGFVLAEHSDELADCFEVGVEVESWRTLRELGDKVRHYLAHPEERRRIAEAGRARVLRDHRLSQRAERLLTLAGLPVPAPPRRAGPA